jgi:hypothetical protein
VRLRRICLDPDIWKSNHNEFLSPRRARVPSLKRNRFRQSRQLCIDVCHIKSCLYDSSTHLRNLSEGGCHNSPHLPALKATIALLYACSDVADSVDNLTSRYLMGKKVIFLDEYFRAVGEAIYFEDEACAERYSAICDMWDRAFEEIVKYCAKWKVKIPSGSAGRNEPWQFERLWNSRHNKKHRGDLGCKILEGESEGQGLHLTPQQSNSSDSGVERRETTGSTFCVSAETSRAHTQQHPLCPSETVNSDSGYESQDNSSESCQKPRASGFRLWGRIK